MVNSISFNEANKRSISEYMLNLGSIKGRNSSSRYSFFLSPFTNENTASFCVNEVKNRFHDYSSGKRGSLLDLVMMLDGVDLNAAAVKVMGSDVGFQRESSSFKGKMEVLGNEPLTTPLLFDYIVSRKINLSIAKKYLREVTYSVGGYTFNAIGFKNVSGGWELRKEGWKGGSSPKNISVIHGDTKWINVFEGFFDFLSFLTLIDKDVPDYHSVVLNSVVFKDRVANDNIRLYVDNDRAGDDVMEYYDGLYNVRDMRVLFKEYNDLNDFLMKK